MQSLANIFWLIGKELKSVLGDPVMVILILWSFVVAVMLEASGAADTVQNAAIAIVDEDRSALTRQIAGALDAAVVSGTGLSQRRSGCRGDGSRRDHVRAGLSARFCG